MLLAVPVFRCHFCSQMRPGWRIHRLGSINSPAQCICDYCYEWHQKALAFLGGGEIPGCQICGATWGILRDAVVESVEVRMYVVPKDGIYQVLCSTCIRPYVSTRADLYAGTRFGTEVLKI